MEWSNTIEKNVRENLQGIKLPVEVILKVLTYVRFPSYYSDFLKKNIKIYILRKKVHRWGKGIFVNTVNREDGDCYIPAHHCYLFRYGDIEQLKLVENCWVCNYRFTMGPHYLRLIEGPIENELPWSLIKAYCNKCWVPKARDKWMEYRNDTGHWIWPLTSKELIQYILSSDKSRECEEADAGCNNPV